jgi:hypothetical protein
MITRDKLMHVYMGVAACVVLTVVHYVSFGLGLLIGCAAFGIFYEVQQWYRKEGQVEIMDALATASPGIVAFIALEAIKWTR